MATFVAIDFETANHSRDSACAIGLVVCSDGGIVDSRQFLIRPPSREFVFTYIHGLRWEDVRGAPTFGDLWPMLRQYVRRADFLVAHNSAFDRSVLKACCELYRVRMPATPFECTVQIARNVWSIYPTKLPDVCGHLDIPLRHHDASSDAEACAQIVLAAEQEGWAR